MSFSYFLIEFFTAIILLLITTYFYYYYKQYHVEKFFQQFPSPPSVLLLGHALDFRTPTDLLKTSHRYRREYGRLVGVKIGLFKRGLLCSDYKFLEFIFSSNKLIKKSPDYQYLESWLGTGLLTSTGRKWKSHRKIITPTFHFKILEQFIEIFESTHKILIEKLQRHVGEDSFDIYPYINLCTLDIICESAMGTKVDAQNNQDSSYVTSVKEMCRILVDRSMTPLMNQPLIYRFTSDYRKEKKALKILHDYTNNVISRKRQELEENKKRDILSQDHQEENDDDSGVRKRKLFIDILLEATINGQPLTREEIREEVDTFMFEGHDTTSAAISFTLYCLANHKDVQDKVYQEQLELFPTTIKSPKITYANLQEMKYLENVIKESLRLYPPVPMYGRETDEDIYFDDLFIPKGVGITLFAHGIHMDPLYFPEPEKFDPNRFNEDNNQQRLPYAYVPFSAGARNCIGQKFAMLELKSVISAIVRHFVLVAAKPDHKLELSAEAVLKSLNGIKVALHLRS